VLQESGIRVQGSNKILRGSVTGIWHPASGIIVPIIANFTVLLFYFFKKKKIKNIRTFRSTFLKSLKYKVPKLYEGSCIRDLVARGLKLEPKESGFKDIEKFLSLLGA
jgi:hypothetical protein